MEMTQCRSIPEYVIPVNPKFDYFDSNLVICALEHIPTFVCLSPMATIPITNFDVPVMTLINIHLHSKPFEWFSYFYVFYLNLDCSNLMSIDWNQIFMPARRQTYRFDIHRIFVYLGFICVYHILALRLCIFQLIFTRNGSWMQLKLSDFYQTMDCTFRNGMTFSII